MATSHFLITKGTPLIRATDLAVSQRDRYAPLQQAFGTIAAGSYTSGDTVIFAEVPTYKIISVQMISTDATPVQRIYGPSYFPTSAAVPFTFTTTAQSGGAVDFIVTYLGDDFSGKSGYLPQCKII